MYIYRLLLGSSFVSSNNSRAASSAILGTRPLLIYYGITLDDCSNMDNPEALHERLEYTQTNHPRTYYYPRLRMILTMNVTASPK